MASEHSVHLGVFVHINLWTLAMGQLSKESSASAARNRSDLSRKAPVFMPVTNLNDQVQNMMMLAAVQNQQSNFNSECCDFDPAAPAFVVPSQTLVNERAELHLERHLPAAVSMSAHDFSEPPGLERCYLAQSDCQGASRVSKNAENKMSSGTMKNQLEALQTEDPATVFIARGINKLGFSSARILKSHFSHYGQIKRIHVSASRVKSMHRYGEARPKEIHWRRRAAPLGFIVMQSAESVSQILALGLEQDVNGVTVRLQPFHRHSYTKEPSEDSGDEGDCRSR